MNRSGRVRTDKKTLDLTRTVTLALSPEYYETVSQRMGAEEMGG